MQNQIAEKEKIQLDFKSLAPRADVDLSVYEKAFKFALSDTRIKNIAITGSYGAGKSSVVETFKNTVEGQKYKYLHISLAHFEKANEIPTDEIQHGEIEHLLEGKIINQLMHKIPVERIPDSRVAIKKSPDKGQVERWSVGIVIGILLVLYFSLFVPMTKIDTHNLFLKWLCISLTKWDVFIPAVIVACILLYKLVEYLVSVQMKTRFFKRICFKDGEIEIFGSEKENEFSYFDRYLDEIKYLFRNAEIDVFVFEDIDRYGTNLIFEKLREINDIINVEREKSIRFFYLLRDDLFIEKDRTKFFDFIIPILPVISKHNSFNIYLKYIENGVFPLRREFLKQISLYIDDMRILNNIYNEYQIYQTMLSEISVGKSAEKIFSIVTYKNLFPAEFILLQRGEGYVVALLEEKEKQVDIKVREIQEKIEDLELQFAEKDRISKEQNLKGQKELDALFLKLEETYRVERKTIADYVNASDFIADIIAKPQEVEYKNGAYWYNATGKIDSAITSMKNNPEYKQRKEELEKIEQFRATECKRLQTSILEKKAEMDRMKSLSFREYAAAYGFEKIQEAVIKKAETTKNEHVLKITKSLYIKLIQFLLTNGYIDENYSDFIAVFQNDDISQGDKKYVRAVLDNEPLAYNYPIAKPKHVREYLDENNIQTVAFLNYDMFSYFMRNETEENCALITNAIMSHKVYDFISMLLDDKDLPYTKWIGYFTDVCPEILQYLTSQNGMEDKAKLFVALSLLGSKAPNYSEIQEVCKSSVFFEKVMCHDNMTSMQRNAVIQNFVNNIKKLQWKLNYFEFDVENSKDFSDAVYENDLYEVNFDMIEQILSVYYQITVDEKDSYLYDKIADTSSATEVEQSALHKYVDSNMDAFVDVLLKESLCLQEIQEVNSLSQINALISRGLLGHATTNIFRYYDLYNEKKEYWEELGENFEDTDLLVPYIKQFTIDELQFSIEEVRYNNNKNNDRMSALMTKIAQSDEIDPEIYRIIVTSLNRVWAGNAPSDISSDRLDILIEENIIKMNQSMLLSMRKKYPNHVRKFILANENVYFTKVLDKENFDMQECLSLLESDISDERKIELLLYTTEGVSVQNDSYSEKLILHILENNYVEDDFEYIVQEDYESEELQTHINVVAQEGIKKIIDNSMQISKSVAMHLLSPSADFLTLSQKKLILAENVDRFTKQEVKNIVRELNITEYIPFFENKNPIVDGSTINRTVLEALQKVGYIGRITELENGEFRVYSKKKL